MFHVAVEIHGLRGAVEEERKAATAAPHTMSCTSWRWSSALSAFGIVAFRMWLRNVAQASGSWSFALSSLTLGTVREEYDSFDWVTVHVEMTVLWSSCALKVRSSERSTQVLDAQCWCVCLMSK